MNTKKLDKAIKALWKAARHHDHEAFDLARDSFFAAHGIQIRDDSTFDEIESQLKQKDWDAYVQYRRSTSELLNTVACGARAE